MHVVPNGEIKVVSNKTRGWSRAVVDVGVAVRRERGPRPRRAARRSGPVLHRQDLGRAARRAGGGARRRVAERQRRGPAHHDPHPARLAVGRGARVPPPHQEPVRPRGASRFRSRSAACTCASRAGRTPIPVAHAAAGAAGG